MQSATKLRFGKKERRPNASKQVALFDSFRATVEAVAEYLAERAEFQQDESFRSRILEDSIRLCLTGFAWAIWSGRGVKVGAQQFFETVGLEPSPDSTATQLIVARVGTAAGLSAETDAIEYGVNPLAALAGIEPSTLASLYEHILCYRLEPSSAGSGSPLKLLLHDKAKKRQGNFYTPKELSRLAVAQALEPLVGNATTNEILSLKIVDPSMGGGSFLGAALHYLSSALHTGRIQPASASELLDSYYAVAINCLYGVDLDPLAVELCLLTLFLETGCRELRPEFFRTLRSKLRRGNSLLGAWCTPVPPTLHLPELRTSMDRFCARLLGVETAENFRERFDLFHWQIEFPEVFVGDNPGFDAVIGNPPWEIEKPNSREFFCRFDSGYWNYGKQDALQLQQKLFDADLSVHRAWCEYRSQYDSFRRWIKQADRSCAERIRLGTLDYDVTVQPFQHQGKADLNAYKLFLEQSHNLLKTGGIMSLIVPAGIYSDLGARDLRRLFLHRSRWHSIYGFENRKGLFSIHRSFKFCIIAVQKGQETESVQAWFMLADTEPVGVEPLSYLRSFVDRFSPSSSTILECENRRDLEILEQIYGAAETLNDTGWTVSFEREFDMTNDSGRFVARQLLEDQGYLPDQYGYWLRGRWRERIDEKPDVETVVSADGRFQLSIKNIDDIALPLYEGRMIGQFDFSQKGWISGKGRRADWLDLGEEKQLRPQYLVPKDEYPDWSEEMQLKCGYLAVGSPTNSRSMIASVVDSLPCGNSVPVFKSNSPLTALQLVACFNSYVFDFALRCRLSGNNLNYFLIAESPLPRFADVAALPELALLTACLNLNHVRFAPFWTEAARLFGWNCRWAIDGQTRRSIRSILDAAIAHLFGLDAEALSWILRGCDAGAEVQPVKGFWRAERHVPIELRHSTLTHKAFAELRKSGCEQFLKQAAETIPLHPVMDIELHTERLSRLKNLFRFI